MSQSPRRGPTGKGLAALAIVVLMIAACIGSIFFGISWFTSQQAAVPTQSQPLPTQAAPRPTQAPVGSLPTQAPAAVPTQAPVGSLPTQASSGPVTNLPQYTVGFDAFGPYYNLILVKQLKLDEKYGFNLNLIPFCSTGENCYGEADRTTKITNGEWDGLLTTLDKLALNPGMGKLTAFVDETDGADKFVCRPEIRTFNDLRGKRIAYLDESIGQFMAMYLLNLVKINVTEVQLVPTGSVAEAANLFVNGQVDCVSGWEPDINPALDAGGHELITSSTLRVPVDVIVTSNQARTEKAAQVIAFHKAWFEALKYQFEQPDKAEAQIIAWGNNDWTFVANPGDLIGWLSTTPQASLSRNRSAFANLDAIGARLADYQKVWVWAGRASISMDPVSLRDVADGSFVGVLIELPELQTSAAPVNDTFSFNAKADLPPLDPNRSGETVVAQLPFDKVEFFPDSCRLSDNGKKLILENVIPVLQSAPLIYLRLDGSAALPGNSVYGMADVEQTARCRADEVKNFIVDRSGGTIDPDRIATDWSQPQYPGSLDPAQLAADRFVRFTLVTVGR